MVAAITLTRVSKTYGPRKAVDAVDLSIAPGEMVALVGASGSGKSTLLRLIAGLIQPDKEGGTILAPRAAGRIGFIFQQFNLTLQLPLVLNVATGLLARMPWYRTACGLFRRQELEKAAAALARVGLADFAWQKTGQLSGGQQQRGAIARALVQDAEILLADEPVASLDPDSAGRVMALLESLNRDGMTILVSLHQIDFARRYCQRIVALKDGRIAYDGPAAAFDETASAAIYETPPPALEKAA